MKALLLIDIQRDFLPGGALAVPEGDAILPVVARLMSSDRFDLVVASQDWHPANHASFAAVHGKEVGDVVEVEGLQQLLWPVHCVQGSEGAELSPELDRSRIDAIICKGEDPRIDSYSAFYDNGRRHSTGLSSLLREKGVDQLVVVGLATDYCVRFTVLHALEEGFDVVVLKDGCRGIDARPGAVDTALAEMQRAGARVTESHQWEDQN